MSMSDIFGKTVPISNIKLGIDKMENNVLEGFLFSKNKKKYDVNKFWFSEKSLLKTPKIDIPKLNSIENNNLFKLNHNSTQPKLNMKLDIHSKNNVGKKEFFTTPAFDINKFLWGTTGKKTSKKMSVQDMWFSNKSIYGLPKIKYDFMSKNLATPVGNLRRYTSTEPEPTAAVTTPNTNTIIDIYNSDKDTRTEPSAWNEPLKQVKQSTKGVIGKAWSAVKGVGKGFKNIGSQVGGGLKDVTGLAAGQIKYNLQERAAKTQLKNELIRGAKQELQAKRYTDKYGEIFGGSTSKGMSKLSKDRIRMQRDKITTLRQLRKSVTTEEEKAEYDSRIQEALDELDSLQEEAIKSGGGSGSGGDLTMMQKIAKVKAVESIFEPRPGFTEAFRQVGRGIGETTTGIGTSLSMMDLGAAMTPIPQGQRVNDITGMPQTSYGFQQMLGIGAPKKSYTQIVSESTRRSAPQQRNVFGLPQQYSELGQSSYSGYSQAPQQQYEQPVEQPSTPVQTSAPKPQPSGSGVWSPYSKRPVTYTRGPYKKSQQQMQ